MADILRKYLSEFGTTYVQILVNGRMVELNFDHNPKQSEIDVIVEKIKAIPPDVIAEPAPKLTVETAIAYLKMKYTKVTVTGLIPIPLEAKNGN